MLVHTKYECMSLLKMNINWKTETPTLPGQPPFLDIRIAVINPKKVQVTFLNHFTKDLESITCAHDRTMDIIKSLHNLSSDSFTSAMSYKTYMNHHSRTVYQEDKEI